MTASWQSEKMPLFFPSNSQVRQLKLHEESLEHTNTPDSRIGTPEGQCSSMIRMGSGEEGQCLQRQLHVHHDSTKHGSGAVALIPPPKRGKISFHPGKGISLSPLPIMAQID